MNLVIMQDRIEYLEVTTVFRVFMPDRCIYLVEFHYNRRVDKQLQEYLVALIII